MKIFVLSHWRLYGVREIEAEKSGDDYIGPEGILKEHEFRLTRADAEQKVIALARNKIRGHEHRIAKLRALVEDLES